MLYLTMHDFVALYYLHLALFISLLSVTLTNFGVTTQQLKAEEFKCKQLEFIAPLLFCQFSCVGLRKSLECKFPALAWCRCKKKLSLRMKLESFLSLSFFHHTLLSSCLLSFTITLFSVTFLILPVSISLFTLILNGYHILHSNPSCLAKYLLTHLMSF